jgi:8-oxo-dGTP diphosphatase
MIDKIDHLGIACKNLQEATAFWRDALGLEFLGSEEVPGQQVRAAFLRVGETNIELLEPTGPDSPVAKFLESKGEGFHHIAFRIRDLEGTLKKLGKKGIRLINKEAVDGAHGMRVAFLHPSATGKVLVELCSRPGEESPFRNPLPTVDVIINIAPQGENPRIILIKRRNPPHGWAIPGGFIEYGESAETSALREAKEETGLDVKIDGLLGVYSSPGRDPRFHTISTVFYGSGGGIPAAGDDAAEIGLYGEENLPREIAFDHRNILEDYFRARKQRGAS